MPDRGRLFLAVALILGAAPAGLAADPTDLEAALVRLEATLGRYNPDQQAEWRVPTKSEYRSQPKEGEGEVLDVFDGLKVVGHPFRDGDSISFDEVWQWERTVFDVGPDGTRTFTRRQVSHNVTRFSISLKEGVWLAHGLMLTNGVHSYLGKSAFHGTVQWHDDGFELVGTGSVSRFYAAAGKHVLGAAHGGTRYRRDGAELLIQVKQQPYQLATDGNGHLTQFPDLGKPFGSLYAVEYRSSPRSVAK